MPRVSLEALKAIFPPTADVSTIEAIHAAFDGDERDCLDQLNQMGIRRLPASAPTAGKPATPPPAVTPTASTSAAPPPAPAATGMGAREVSSESSPTMSRANTSAGGDLVDYESALATGDEKRRMEYEACLSEAVKGKLEDLKKVQAADQAFEQFVRKQREYGPQSLRDGKAKGGGSTGQLSSLTGHTKTCFDKMIERERELCGEFVVFYHSYSFAALIYEVQAAIARIVYGFPGYPTPGDISSAPPPDLKYSGVPAKPVLKEKGGKLTWGWWSGEADASRAAAAVGDGPIMPPMPRLSKKPFLGKPHVQSLVKAFSTMCGQDHDPKFREVAISVSMSLISNSSEAPPHSVFENGYSCTDLSFFGVLRDLVASALGITPAKAGEIVGRCDKVKSKYSLSGQYTESGGGASTVPKPGHMLQIFVRSDCVDDVAYGSHAYGVYRPDANPLSKYLTSPTAPDGQARVFWHPTLFLDPRTTRVYHYAGNEAAMRGRPDLQRELMQIITSATLGVPSNVIRALRCIEGLDVKGAAVAAVPQPKKGKKPSTAATPTAPDVATDDVDVTEPEACEVDYDEY